MSNMQGSVQAKQGAVHSTQWLAVTAVGLVVCLAVRGRYRTGDTQSSDSGSAASS